MRKHLASQHRTVPPPSRGAVGGTTALTSLSTDAGGTVAINGGVVNTTGAQSYGEVATLGTATTLTSTGAGAITFGNTLNGAQTLAINTAGATTFTGAVGGTKALTSLTTDAVGTVAINGGVVNTTGAQSFGEVATLGAATTLTSTSAGAITFGNTLNGAQTLAVNTSGATTFTGAVGNSAALTSLTTNAGGTVAINGGAVNTTGAQSYGEVATLGAATTLTSTGAGAITFGNTLNGAQTLAVNTSGATTFTGSVGNSTALTSLTTNAGGTVAINGGVVNTTGAQSYGDAATLGADTTLTSTGAGDINFGSTLNGAQTLSINTAGVTTFNGDVGNSTALTSLTTNIGGSVVVNGGLIKTTGAQTFNDAITLGADTVLQGVNVALMSTVDGTQALTIKDSGTTVLGDIIGGTTPLMSLTTDSLTTPAGENHLKGSGIYTTTDAVFHDIVKIFTDVTVQAAGQMTFAQTVNGDTAGTRSLTLDGGNTAVIRVDGAVGATMPLNTLTLVNSASTALNGGLTTSTLTVAAVPKAFDLTLRGHVAVTNAVTLGNTGIAQLGGVESDDLLFSGGLVASAPSSLRVAGTLRSNNQAIVLGRSGGSITMLADTNINSGSGSLRLASAISAGQEPYVLRLLSTGPTTIDGNMSTAGALSFAGPVAFSSAATTVSAVSTTFAGAVTAQGSLTINGATVINGGSVNTGSSAQTYNGSVDIGGAATSTTTFTGVGISFGNTLDATSRVMVNDSGATTYTGAIGLTRAPAHFETDASGSSTFSGGIVRTSSPNSIYIADDAVVTAASTTFDTTNNGALTTGANITFAKTLNGSANNTKAVLLNAGTAGSVLVTGSVGNTQPLSTLTLVNSNGAIFSSAVTTGTSVVLTDTTTGQTIRFAANLTTPALSTAARPYVLELFGANTSITGAGVTNFIHTGGLKLGNLVGDSLSFTGGLTATAPSSISASGQINTSNAPMSLGDSNTAVTLINHLTLTTGGAALSIGGAIEGTTANTQSLTLNAGATGAVSVLGTVGLNTPLKTLTLSNSGRRDIQC